MTPSDPEVVGLSEALARAQKEERALRDEALARESAQTQRLAEALQDLTSEPEA